MISQTINPQVEARNAEKELLQRALARKHLLDFACYIDPKQAGSYRARHLAYVADQYTDLFNGKFKRLMVLMPNRHWKSSLGSMKFPAWAVGNWYEEGEPHQAMIISHTEPKAAEFSAYSRDLVRDVDDKGKSLYHNIFPNIRISRTRQSSGRWGLLDKRGMEEPFPTMLAGSIMAPPTGDGARLIIVDDTIKKPEDAHSMTYLDKQYAGWAIGVASRLNNPDCLIVFNNTRWAPLDLPGRLIKRQIEDFLADQWHIVMLPALAYTEAERTMARRMGVPVNDDDPIGRKPGEALWPAVFPREWHLKQKANNPRAFATIGQQLPIPESGNLISRDTIKHLALPPKENISWIIPTDWAVKEKQVAKDDPDFCVAGLMGVWLPDGDKHNANIVLASVVRTQMGSKAGKEMVVRFALAMSALLGGIRPHIVAAPANIDTVILNELRGHPDLLNWRLRSLADANMKKRFGSYGGDKVEMSGPWRDRAEGGRFYVVDEKWSQYALVKAFPQADRKRLLGEEPLAWHEKSFIEMEAFPEFSHDDIVDMISVGSHAGGLSSEKREIQIIAKPQGWFS